MNDQFGFLIYNHTCRCFLGTALLIIAWLPIERHLDLPVSADLPLAEYGGYAFFGWNCWGTGKNEYIRQNQARCQADLGLCSP